MEQRWYVIHTRPRKEDQARENLERQGFEVYLPLMQQKRRRRGRWLEVIEPMFPRYLFIHLALYADNIAPIRSTRGVHSIVRFGDMPTPIADEFIHTLRNGEDALLGCHRPDRPLFKKGDKVVLTEGPFAQTVATIYGLQGRDRVILMLQLLGRETRVTVPMEQVLPATA